MIRTALTLLAVFALVPCAFADNHENSWRGVDLDKNFGMQFEVCSLQAGKSIADVAKLDARLKQAWSKMNINLSMIRLTPMFSHGMPGQSNVDYIDLVMGDINGFGAAWDAWMVSDEAAKLMADAAKLGDCRFKFGQGVNIMLNAAELDSTDNRLMTMNWCGPKEGVSYEQLKAKHGSWLADNGDDLDLAAWNIFAPRLGAGSRQGKFMHLVSYTSASKLMANQDWLANGGGAAAMRDYENSYASCEGESAWIAEYIIKPAG